MISDALAACRRWRDAGHDVHVAVNVTFTDLPDADFPLEVTAARGQHGVDPGAVILERTSARCPSNEVKIDRSFVAEMRSDTTAKAIVRSTFGLAHSLGMRVVAEGVEDDDTWATLAGLNCELIQGYTLSRPLPRRPAALADRARPRRGAEADQRYLRWLKSPSCRHAGREHRADVEDQRDRPLRVRER